MRFSRKSQTQVQTIGSLITESSPEKHYWHGCCLLQKHILSLYAPLTLKCQYLLFSFLPNKHISLFDNSFIWRGWQTNAKMSDLGHVCGFVNPIMELYLIQLMMWWDDESLQGIISILRIIKYLTDRNRGHLIHFSL